MMKAFFIAIWHWIKSVFNSLFGYREQPEIETDPLLVADPANQQGEINAEMPVEHRNSNVAIHHILHEPIKLSDEESLLVLYYAHKGSNMYLDRLPAEKKQLAYELIRQVVELNIENVDRSITALKRLNPEANRLESSWRRVRADFSHGDASEFNISPTCIKMRDTAPPAQARILDHIIHCFKICKTLLKLTLCKHQAVKKLIPPLPTEEQGKLVAKMSESRMNAKTLAIVDKFNQPYDEVEHPQSKRRYRR